MYSHVNLHRCHDGTVAGFVNSRLPLTRCRQAVMNIRLGSGFSNGNDDRTLYARTGLIVLFLEHSLANKRDLATWGHVNIANTADLRCRERSTFLNTVFFFSNLIRLLKPWRWRLSDR